MKAGNSIERVTKPQKADSAKCKYCNAMEMSEYVVNKILTNPLGNIATKE